MNQPPAAAAKTGADASRFHRHKRAAVESFLAFAEGGPAPQWPLEVFLEVSNICDLQCAMCPTFSALNPHRFTVLKSRDRGLIAMDQATEPLESVLQHALVVHAFGYGEPTLHPQFQEFLDYLSQFEVMVDFFTHGMHLTEELCEFLVARRISRISISFSGATREDYENVYLGGDFDRVLAGIKRLDAAKQRANSPYPAINVNSLGFEHHIQALPDFVDLMGRHGVNVIHLKPLQSYDEIAELHGHVAGMRPEVEGEILQRAKAIAEKYDLRLASRPFENMAPQREKRHKGEAELSEQVVNISELKNIARSADKKAAMREQLAASEAGLRKTRDAATGTVQHQGTPCMEPFKTLYANFNGKVYPCCFKDDKGQPLGELGDSSAESIWNGERATSIRDGIEQGEYPADICSRCLKAGNYPKQLGLAPKLNQYSRWFRQAFGVPFHTHLLRAARALPDNYTLMQKRADRAAALSDDVGG